MNKHKLFICLLIGYGIVIFLSWIGIIKPYIIPIYYMYAMIIYCISFNKSKEEENGNKGSESGGQGSKHYSSSQRNR